MNKVNTKVDMRLNVALTGWISEDLKDALQRLVSAPHCTLSNQSNPNSPL